MWYHDSMMIPYHIRYHYIKLSFFVYWYCGTCRSCVLLHFIVVQTGCGVWCKDEGHLDTPQSLLDSSLTMVEVTSAYATHFIDMYVDKHTGKHMTGERVRVRILLLTLPFLLRDLIAPEVCSTFFWFDILMILHDIVSYIM
jgi:hypothetical protein